MATEIKKEIEGYINASRACGLTGEKLENIRSVLEDFAEYLKIREKVRAEKARLYFTSKL
jgi:hypothetical protein